MLGREDALDMKPLCAEESESAEFWILSVRLDFETSG